MSRIWFALWVVLAAAGARADETAPTGVTLPPAAPETTIVTSNCQVCHTLQYVTQQRLTEPLWKKTVEKMVKFGSPVPAADVPRLVAFLAAHLGPDVPDGTPARVAAPPAALPKRAKR